MRIVVRVDRIRTLGDSVLMVGIVLLVYNLATLAASDPDLFDPEIFANTLLAYISSFIVVFLYYTIFTSVLSFNPEISRIDFLQLFIALVLISLIPVANIAFLQQEGVIKVYFEWIVNIIPGLAMIPTVFNLKRKGTLDDGIIRYLLVSMCTIPAVYSISLVVFIFTTNETITQVIPLCLLPLFFVLERKKSQ